MSLRGDVDDDEEKEAPSDATRTSIRSDGGLDFTGTQPERRRRSPNQRRITSEVTIGNPFNDDNLAIGRSLVMVMSMMMMAVREAVMSKRG
jgi:hypothetical protein